MAESARRARFFDGQPNFNHIKVKIAVSVGYRG